jgi:hypothetical protein
MKAMLDPRIVAASTQRPTAAGAGALQGGAARIASSSQGALKFMDIDALLRRQVRDGAPH